MFLKKFWALAFKWVGVWRKVGGFIVWSLSSRSEFKGGSGLGVGIRFGRRRRYPECGLSVGIRFGRRRRYPECGVSADDAPCSLSLSARSEFEGNRFGIG
jgi:hypothetical protein